MARFYMLPAVASHLAYLESGINLLISLSAIKEYFQKCKTIPLWVDVSMYGHCHNAVS